MKSNQPLNAAKKPTIPLDMPNSVLLIFDIFSVKTNISIQIL